MRKLLRTLSVFILAAVVGLSACKDDDSDSCDNGAFEMTLNGDAFTAKNFDNTLLIGEDVGVGGKRMDLRITDKQGREVVITFNDMTSGTEGNGVTTDDVYIPISEIGDQSDNVFFFNLFTDDDIPMMMVDGTLDITSCDPEKKQVSGTFTFFDEDNNEVSGSFTNLCYRILRD